MLCDWLNFGVNVWASSYMEAWVDKMLAWAKSLFSTDLFRVQSGYLMRVQITCDIM